MSISGKQTINVGQPNQSAGSDSLFEAFNKAKTNFEILFNNASPFTTFAGSNGVSVESDANSGNVTITNTGVTELVAGPGVALSNSTGNVTIAFTGGNGNGVGTVTSIGVVPVSNTRLTTSNTPVVTEGNIAIDLVPTGVVPGTYQNPNVTVDLYGRVTSMSNSSATGVTSVVAGNGISVSSQTGNVTLSVSGFGNVSSINLDGNVSNVLRGDGTFAADSESAYNDSNVVSLLGSFGSNTISTTGLLTADGGGLSNVPYANITGTPALGNVSALDLDGNVSNVLRGDGTFAADAESTYGDSNVVSLLGSFGSNNISTTGNVDAGNIKTDNLLYANGDPYNIDSFLSDDGTTTDITSNTISVINLPANTEIGPISEFLFDTTHNHTSNTTGIVCWNTDDDTLNINHSGGVTQQVGQELYGYVRNNTGNTITNGTCVRFDGAESPDGEARLEVAPFLANGTFPDIYALGIATQDIDDGEDGRVTTWGKVRNIDASGNTVNETWNVGDILYANPDEAGLLTNVKPTAPDNVVPIAAVLSNDSVTGELFVRPTVEQKMSYGVFTRTTDLSPTNDTPAVVGFDTDEISNGVTLESNTQVTVSQSGLYQIEWTLHWDSQGTGFGTDPVYTFLRKNGTDIPNTLRRNSVSDFDDAGQTFTNTRTLSLDADDYIEVVVVTTGGNVDLVAQSAITSPFNAPATAAAEITVAQIQL